MEILDRDLLVGNTDGDTGLLAELVDLFFETTPEMIAAVHGAVRAGDARALRESAHRLKGTLASVGATAASRVADALETRGREGATGGLSEVVSSLDRELERLEPELRALVRERRG